MLVAMALATGNKMCPAWRWPYPTPLSAAGVLPATEAQHNLPVALLLSGTSLDSNLINNKVLPPRALGAQQPQAQGLAFLKFFPLH